MTVFLFLFNSAGGGLEFSAETICGRDVDEVVTEDIYVIHIRKGGLSHPSEPETPQGGLQADEEGLQVDDEYERGQGVPLANRKEDSEGRRDRV